MKISNSLSWDIIYVLTNYWGLVLIVTMGLIILCLIKSRSLSLFPIFINEIIILVIYLFPTIFEFDHIAKLPLGVNEYFQDQLSSHFGIEAFFKKTHEILQNEETDEKIHWREDYIASTWDDAYVGMIRYSKDPPKILGEIVVLKSLTAPFEFDDYHSWVHWRDDYSFGSNSELILQILTLKKFKIILMLSTIWVICLTIFALFGTGFQKYSNIHKSFYLCTIAAIPVLFLMVATQSVKHIYIPPQKAFDFFKSASSLHLASSLLADSTQSNFYENSLKEQDIKYDIFISKKRFLPTTYLRINISLFQYVFYAKDHKDIIHPKEMTIAKIAENLFYGYYDEYIRVNNHTCICIYTLIGMQFLAILMTLGVQLRNFMINMKN